jgi:predicted SAM-dependent methyltransferase
MIRINLGCGRTPVKGWKNIDNSYSVRLSRIPLLPSLLLRTGIILQDQFDYLRFVSTQNIEYGDIIKGLKIDSSSAEVFYSSHVLEHLDRREAGIFLQEARRVLAPGGVIRLVVPDLALIIDKYNRNRDADAFVTEIYLAQPKPRTWTQRLRAVVVGSRIHQWVYDGESLCNLLKQHGFVDPIVQKPGETIISEPGEMNLFERADVSIFVEARNGK